MEHTVTVQIGKTARAILMWLWSVVKAAKKLGRENLTGIFVRDGALLAVDGYQLVAVRTVLGDIIHGVAFEDLLRDAKGINPIAINTTTAILDTETNLAQSLDFRTLMPSGQPVFEICINMDMFVKAVENMGHARVRFYGPTVPFEVFGTVGDCDAYALIMPSHMDNGTHTWRPYEPHKIVKLDA